MRNFNEIQNEINTNEIKSKLALIYKEAFITAPTFDIEVCDNKALQFTFYNQDGEHFSASWFKKRLRQSFQNYDKINTQKFRMYGNSYYTFLLRDTKQ